jgi:hypothetical protein
MQAQTGCLCDKIGPFVRLGCGYQPDFTAWLALKPSHEPLDERCCDVGAKEGKHYGKRCEFRFRYTDPEIPLF